MTELMDCDLHFVISSGQALSDDHVQYFLFQLLLGLNHIHMAGVVHRDLKPHNILLNKDCELRICDFGLARHLAVANATEEEDQRLLTMYVTTRWYRAPELLCLNETYTTAVDMWSAGCILAEMLGRKALFPGRDYLDQIRLIIEVLGTPSESELNTLQNQRAVQYIRRLPPRNKMRLSVRLLLRSRRCACARVSSQAAACHLTHRTRAGHLPGGEPRGARPAGAPATVRPVQTVHRCAGAAPPVPDRVPRRGDRGRERAGERLDRPPVRAASQHVR